MTTIAFDSNTIAADTQLTSDSMKLFCRKIFRIPEKHWIWCGAGNAHVEAAVLDYIRNGGPEPERKELKGFEALIYNYQDKTIWFMDSSIHLQPVVDSLYTIGSGGKVARAAMLLGLPAKAAVELASEVDIYTNNIVDVYSLDTDKIYQMEFNR